MDDNNIKNNQDLQENNNRLNDEDIDTSDTNEINYVSIFMPIGTGLGVSLGIAFDNLAIGISFGVSLGLLIGAVAESAKKKK